MVKKPVASEKKITVKPKAKTVKVKPSEPEKKDAPVKETVKKSVAKPASNSTKVLTAEGWKRRKIADIEAKKSASKKK